MPPLPASAANNRRMKCHRPPEKTGGLRMAERAFAHVVKQVGFRARVLPARKPLVHFAGLSSIRTKKATALQRWKTDFLFGADTPVGPPVHEKLFWVKISPAGKARRDSSSARITTRCLKGQFCQVPMMPALQPPVNVGVGSFCSVPQHGN